MPNDLDSSHTLRMTQGALCGALFYCIGDGNFLRLFQRKGNIVKLLFSFLFTVLIISPSFAVYNTGTTADVCGAISNQNTCNQTAGCGWGVSCRPCTSLTYNSGSSNNGCIDFGSCNPNTPTDKPQCSGDGDDCWTRPVGASSCDDWVCANEYQPAASRTGGPIDSCIQCPNKVDNAVYSGDCENWYCKAGYYKAWDNSKCIHWSKEDVGVDAANYELSIDWSKLCTGTYRAVKNSDGSVKCEKCPNGYFKNSADATVCQLPDNTKFCDKDGNNCIELIPKKNSG